MGRFKTFVLLALVPWTPSAYSQPAAVPQWQIDAGGKKAFDVASIKLATGDFRGPLFPLDNSDAFNPTGGRFFAQFTLLTFIQFAWKTRPTREQAQTILAPLPKWVATDRFEIEARAGGNPTKDQMRLMMQSLLADRFHLALHFETRETAVFGLTLVKPGKLGPKIRPHSEGPPCDKAVDPDVVFPERCDAQALMARPGRALLAGSRNTTLDLIASSLAGLGGLGRPGVDQTGLTGRYDFTLEWFDETGAFRPSPAAPAPGIAADAQGPSFLEALRDQLGMTMESTRAPVQFPVIDHIERLSEN
jgi:uncharacterized protein (TIGR03435 family)